MPLQNGLKSGKVVSISDIQKVQNYIEKCLQLYLSQKEVSLLPLKIQEGLERCVLRRLSFHFTVALHSLMTFAMQNATNCNANSLICCAQSGMSTWIA